MIKPTVDKIDKYVETAPQPIKDIWNTAIDKCIEVANKYDSYGPAYEMRMLKK